LGCELVTTISILKFQISTSSMAITYVCGVHISDIDRNLSIIFGVRRGCMGSVLNAGFCGGFKDRCGNRMCYVGYLMFDQLG